MKIFDLAMKDILRNLRSVFLLVMMFVIPILITGIIYFAFGSSGDDQSIQPTRLSVVNLDQPHSSSVDFSAELMKAITGERIKDLIIISESHDRETALAAIRSKEVDAALVIPPNFSDSLFMQGGKTTIDLFYDPALGIQLKVVQSILETIINGFNSSRIAMSVAASQFEKYNVSLDEKAITMIMEEYTTYLRSGSGNLGGDGILKIRTPSSDSANQSLLKSIMTGIMGAQLIFFVFFTGTTFAQSLLKENEEKTLPRLFTTPTTMAEILAAKILGAMLMILIQIVVLVLVSKLIFNFDWGNPLSLVFTMVFLDVAAASFGVMVMSLVKSTQQAGFVVGGVMTATSMIGIFPIMMQSTLPALNTASLFTPQGWAMKALKLTVDGAGLPSLVLPLAVLLAASIVFFVIGVFLFRRRFA